MTGTSAQRWLAGKMTTLKVSGTEVLVPDYSTGLQQLMDGKIDVFFGDRAVAIGAVDLGPASTQLEILPREFTHEPVALALPRNDDDFRGVVDRALSDSYAAPGFKDMYSKWAGTMDEKTAAFFQWVSFAP
jgi:ABC-type amino acid transport substrate-binding protein